MPNYSSFPPRWPRWAGLFALAAGVGGLVCAWEPTQKLTAWGVCRAGWAGGISAAFILTGGGVLLGLNRLRQRGHGDLGLRLLLLVGALLAVLGAAGAGLAPSMLARFSAMPGPLSRTEAAAQVATVLALLALARPAVSTRHLHLAQACALLPLVLGAAAILERLAQLPSLGSAGHHYLGLEPWAALGLLTLASGVLMLGPEPGTLAGFLAAESVPSRLTRHLLLAGAVLGPLLALCSSLADVAGMQGGLRGVVFAWVQVLLVCVLAGAVGWALQRSEARRDSAEREKSAALRQMEKQAAALEVEVARRTGALSKALLFNQRLALVASRTTNGVVIANAEGQIEWVNEGFTRITGHAFEDALGHKPGDLLQGPRTDPATIRMMAEKLAAGVGFATELVNYRKDGREYFAAIEVQPLRTPTGELLGFMGIETDITARKLAEDRLKAAKDEAEQLNAALERAIEHAQKSATDANIASQAKSAFLATMSHEIRTPLNGVLGMAALLRDTELSPQQLDLLRTIEVSGEALLSIINDILDYSKIESGKIELEASPFAVRQCVEETLDLLAGKAAEKGIELVGRIDRAVPVLVEGDVTRLRQILVNLVGNALKFTAAGEVEVAVSGATRAGKLELSFAVRDTGIGIPADRMSRLFQPFSQVDSSTTRKFGGSGLGLAISRRLAEVMGGRMWVESTVGVGSTFFFTVAVTEEALPPQAVRTYAADRFAGCRVLVAAPNQLFRESLAGSLAAWGATVSVVAGLTEEGLAPPRDGPWNAILVDQQLLAAGDAPAGRVAAALPVGIAAPLVLLSYPAGGAVTAPFAAQLNKPVKMDSLYEKLGQVLLQPGRDGPAAGSGRGGASAGAAPLKDLRILLVEDNLVNQRVALMLLRKFCREPRTALNGAEALAALDKQPADVIFMDMEMPVMDGCEAARLIRANPALPQPWIVALTANAMHADRLRALNAGMNDFVTKPVRGADIAAALERAEAGLHSGPGVASGR